MSSPRPDLAKLDGFSPAQTYQVLYDLALNVPAEQAIVELGTFHAKGAVYLAEGAAHGGGAHVWTVDPHDLPGYRTTTGNGPEGSYSSARRPRMTSSDGTPKT